MSWSQEHVDLAIKLFTDGLTASQISRKLAMVGGGYTRNAVIGKLTRLGYARSAPAAPSSRAGVKLGQIGGAAAVAKAKTRSAAPKPTIAPKKPAPDNLLAFNMQRRADEARPVAKTPSVSSVAGSLPRPWTTRLFGECAAPVSGEGADTHSCCAPVDGESKWCPEHRALFCVPNKKPLNTRALARVA